MRTQDTKLSQSSGVVEFFDFSKDTQSMQEQNRQTRASEVKIEIAGCLDSLSCFLWVDMGVSGACSTML